MYSESLVDKVHFMYKTFYHTITSMACTVKEHYMINYYHNKGNSINGVMVIVFASSAVDRGSSPCRIKYLKKHNVVGSPLSMQHYGVRTKTGWIRIRMMYNFWELTPLMSIYVLHLEALVATSADSVPSSIEGEKRTHPRFADCT